MRGIDSDELSQVVDRIDEAGEPVTVYLDAERKLRTRTVNQKNKINFGQKGYTIIGVYTIETSFKDLKADIEYVRAM